MGYQIEGQWSFVLQQMASQRNQVQRQQALALMCRFVCSTAVILRKNTNLPNLAPERISFLLYVVQLDSIAILDCHIINNAVAQRLNNVVHLLLWTT